MPLATVNQQDVGEDLLILVKSLKSPRHDFVDAGEVVDSLDALDAVALVSRLEGEPVDELHETSDGILPAEVRDIDPLDRARHLLEAEHLLQTGQPLFGVDIKHLGLLVCFELAPFVERETLPGPEAQSDDALLDFARANGTTTYHLIGTCRMGPETDPTSVVDDQLCIRGLSGIRVVDASVMPSMTSANTYATTLMIAEKAADMIRGRPPLPAAEIAEVA